MKGKHKRHQNSSRRNHNNFRLQNNSIHRDGRARLSKRKKHAAVKVNVNSLSTRVTVVCKKKEKGVKKNTKEPAMGKKEPNSVDTHKLDETHINDWGQVRKKVLLSGQSGPSPASHRFADKLYFPLCQLSRPSFAASHQSKPRILDRTYSKPRTELFLR